MSWLSNAFSGGPNPADSAMPYFQQIPGMEQGYLNPYINQGQNAGNVLSGQLGQMSQDPTGLINSLMAQYQPSQQYQTMDKWMTRGAGNTAAAGGMRGSMNDVANESDITHTLMSQDMQRFLQNALGVKGMGLSGEEGMYNTGFNASRGLASDLGTNLSNEGQLAFQGQREQNQRQQDTLGSIFNGLGMLGGMPEKGGGSVGGNAMAWLGSFL